MVEVRVVREATEKLSIAGAGRIGMGWDHEGEGFSSELLGSMGSNTKNWGELFVKKMEEARYNNQ